MSLSYPFRLYPVTSQNIITNYNDTLTYLDQVIKLYQFIEGEFNEIISVPNTLVLFIVGSLLEENEMFYNKPNQHFPEFLKRYIKSKADNDDTNYQIIIIVINPTNLDYHEHPKFIEKTEASFEWNRQEDGIIKRIYRSNNFPISYYYFNCGIPEYIEEDFLFREKKWRIEETDKSIPKLYISKEGTRRNFLNLNNENSSVSFKNPENQYSLQMLQTSPNEEDKIFVDNFYQKLNICIDRLRDNNGIGLVLNYAVFNNNNMRVSKFYFLKTFHQLFHNNKMMFLSYDFREDRSSNLIKCDDLQCRNIDIYSYDSLNIELKINSRLSYGFELIDHRKKTKAKRFRITYQNGAPKLTQLAYVTTLPTSFGTFKISEIPPDGDCMFQAILYQLGYPITVEQARLYVSRVLMRDYFNNVEKFNNLISTIRYEGYYNNLIGKLRNDGHSEGNINIKLFNKYVKYMQKGPHNPVAEQERINDNLPLNIFYGGEEEMKILTELLGVKINIIRKVGGQYILDSIGYSFTEIFILEDGFHFNVAHKMIGSRLIIDPRSDDKQSDQDTTLNQNTELSQDELKKIKEKYEEVINKKEIKKGKQK